MLAEAEKRQAGFGDDRRGNRQRRLHQNGRQHIRQHITPEDPAVGQTNRPRPFNVFLVADTHHLRTRQAGENRHGGKPDGDHRITQTWAEKSTQRNRQHQKRTRQQRFDHAGDNAVHPALPETGDKPQRNADHNGDNYRHATGHQRGTCPPEQAR
ncbi:hypothetical protein SRABI106_03798 [Rahnella aquatilis]|nr:hypothetical protein SRABI106_03798 [Rahnella aquatilis]